MELTLDLTASRQHLIRCRLRFTPTHQTLELRLPVWTPGSYLQRDYVRQLQNLELVQAGVAVPLVRREPSVWTAQLEHLLPVEVHYAAMATELTVRTCHLDDDHASLALAALALQVNGARWMPHHLQLLLPDGWQPFVPLPFLSGPGEHRWIAGSFDQLVDAPVEAGPHHWHGFAVHGVTHRWGVLVGGGGKPRSAAGAPPPPARPRRAALAQRGVAPGVRALACGQEPRRRRRDLRYHVPGGRRAGRWWHGRPKCLNVGWRRRWRPWSWRWR